MWLADVRKAAQIRTLHTHTEAQNSIVTFGLSSSASLASYVTLGLGRESLIKLGPKYAVFGQQKRPRLIQTLC